MRTLLVRWLINTLALYLAVQVVSGVHYDKGPVGLLIVAAIFGLINSTLRPLLTVLTCPLILLTLGLFTLVINAMLLLLTSWLSNSLDLGFHVDSFGPALVAGLLIGVVSFLLSVLVGEQRVVVRKNK